MKPAAKNIACGEEELTLAGRRLWYNKGVNILLLLLLLLLMMMMMLMVAPLTQHDVIFVKLLHVLLPRKAHVPSAPAAVAAVATMQPIAAAAYKTSLLATRRQRCNVESSVRRAAAAAAAAAAHIAHAAAISCGREIRAESIAVAAPAAAVGHGHGCCSR